MPSRYRDLARILWARYASRRVLFAGRDLLVCEWQCAGEQRPWASEVMSACELDLPRRGMHLRAVGRRRHVIDPATAGFSAADDEYRRASPTASPATSTLIAVRGELAAALVPGRAGHAHRIDADAAALHFRLVRAADPVAVEEMALALVGRILAPAAARRLPGRPPAVPAWRRLAEEIEHVIATRFAERLTLEAIANACRTSTVPRQPRVSRRHRRDHPPAPHPRAPAGRPVRAAARRGPPQPGSRSPPDSRPIATSRAASAPSSAGPRRH